MNSPLTDLEKRVRDALDKVSDPLTGKGLAAAGRLQGLNIDTEGRVRFVLEAPAGRIEPFKEARAIAEAAAKQVAGVTEVTAVLTAHQGAAAPEKPKGILGVGMIIAVASAKGGVGKSTLAVNLAAAYAALGKKAGVLDLDVYGPSMPTLLGLTEKTPRTDHRNHMIPLEAFGLKAMSIGFVVDPEKPLIWRGAMATQAARQMTDEVVWAPLDILVLDMPPGTGDVQLTIGQRLPLDGAIIVSTPQELALADVRRGIVMFDKMHVPILGVIENMAWFEAPDGSKLPLFGEGGAERTAARFGVPFLGALPFAQALRESADQGAPLLAVQPQHPTSLRILEIAEAALENARRAARPAPTIRFE